ncbi:MAG TPA: TraB/GumN family protein [Candidatus Binatia bacterium]|nr:TraB/GumN family protein [Candidatus Binatia bacterium]
MLSKTLPGFFRRVRIELRRRRILGLAFYWVLVATVVLAAAETWAQDKTFLWKVQSAKSNIYLLGSVHFLKQENYPLKQTIEKAFDNAQKLVLEIDFKEADAGAIQRLTLEKGLQRNGKTLEQNVSPETYGLTQKRAAELGIDIRALSPLKPWVVALTLTALQLQKLGFEPKYGVDRYLAARAMKAGKTIVGLESAAFQIGLIDELSEKDQESMLRRSLKEMDLLDRGLDEILRAWSTGNVKSLEALLLRGMREYPAVHQKIIVDRNRRWLPEIERMIEQGESILIVVGAGHLVGKDGVVELLKARGYTVEQM